jgi:hypothetical protein
MSGPIDDALNHLKTCARDVDNARMSAVAALDRVRSAQQRAAQAGFPGVAHHLDQPIRSLESHLPQLAQLASTIEQAVAQLSAITADMTPAEVLTRLRSAKDLISSALDQASTAIVTCADARDQVNVALQGGQPDEILAILEDERRTLADVIKSLRAADAATDKAIREAENVGGG